MMFCKTLLVTAVLTVAACLSPASAQAPPTRTEPEPKPTAAQAYTADGTFRLVQNAGWCLTATGLSTGKPVVIAQCVKGDAFQHWFAYRIPVSGAMNQSANPDTSLAQQVGKKGAVVYFGMKPTHVYVILLDFVPAEHGWFIGSVDDKQFIYLTAPANLKSGKTYQLTWVKQIPISPNGITPQEWLTPPWKHLDS